MKIKRQNIKRPNIFCLTINQTGNLHLDLFGPQAVASQEAAIGQVGGVAAGQFGKTVGGHVAVHR